MVGKGWVIIVGFIGALGAASGYGEERDLFIEDEARDDVDRARHIEQWSQRMKRSLGHGDSAEADAVNEADRAFRKLRGYHRKADRLVALARDWRRLKSDVDVLTESAATLLTNRFTGERRMRLRQHLQGNQRLLETVMGHASGSLRTDAALALAVLQRMKKEVDAGVSGKVQEALKHKVTTARQELLRHRTRIHQSIQRLRDKVDAVPDNPRP